MAKITQKARGKANRTPRLHTPDHQTITPASSWVRIGRVSRDGWPAGLADAWGSARGVPGGLDTSTARCAIDLRNGILRQGGETCSRNRQNHARPHTCRICSPASCTQRARLDEPAARRGRWRRGKERKWHENQLCTPTSARQRAAAARETTQTHHRILGPHTGTTWTSPSAL